MNHKISRLSRRILGNGTVIITFANEVIPRNLQGCALGIHKNLIILSGATAIAVAPLLFFLKRFRAMLIGSSLLLASLPLNRFKNH